MWRCFLPQDAELAAWALGEEHRIPLLPARSQILLPQGGGSPQGKQPLLEVLHGKKPRLGVNHARGSR